MRILKNEHNKEKAIFRSPVKKFVPAWRVEIEKYFSLVVFNYLFSNGDVHLKNFSLLESSNGDYLLSPVYNLVNTRLHVDDKEFALNKGLFRVCP